MRVIARFFVRWMRLLLLSFSTREMHPLGSIIADIRELRRRDWECSFVHTLREDQFCASSGAHGAGEIQAFLSPKARSGHARSISGWELA